MKYCWYYIEVFRDAKEEFRKQKETGVEIPQAGLLEGAFAYLDQRHELGEEEQYDQDQTWKHRMETGCADSSLCTDLYWVFTFCSMMSDLSVYLDGMIQGNGEGFKRGLNKVMEPFDGRLSYGEQAAYRMDVICYVVMTMNERKNSPEGTRREISRVLENVWTQLSNQIRENGKTARISRYVQKNDAALADVSLLTESVMSQDNGTEDELVDSVYNEEDQSEEDAEDQEKGFRDRRTEAGRSRKKGGFGKKAAMLLLGLAAAGLVIIGGKTLAGNLAEGFAGASFELASEDSGVLDGLEQVNGGTWNVSSYLTGKSGTVYGADFLHDGDPSTPWEEGVEGDGIGEQITYEPEEGTKIQAIRIYPGNGRSDQAFTENNRPSELTLEIDGKKQTLKLDDSSHYYTFYSKKAVSAKEIKLTIDSVYQGSKWQDTCISEVEFYGTR